MKMIISFVVLLLMTKSFLFANTTQEMGHAVILQYHRFEELRYPSTDILMKRFEYQVTYLVEHHYNVWPLSKIVRHLKDHKPLPPKTVALTMDDAYQSVYTQAYPLLKKYHLPFTVFVNTLPVIHRSKRYLSWNEMREMGKHGAEFANHTYSHPYLVRMDKGDPKKWKRDIIKEIQSAQKKIEKELPDSVCTDPKMLAYPFGEYDDRVLEVMKKFGYVGIAQNSGPINDKSDLLTLPRFPMSGGFGTKKGFLLKLNTLPLPIQSVSTAKTVVSKETNPPILEITLQKALPGIQCFTSNGKKIAMQWLSKTKVKIQSKVLLKYPRDHYTCTAPAKNGRWYWYSHFWVIPHP
jgi:poly-beta-1,6-N-acetyl-D-glucosamine N-deacetylase